MALSLRLTDSSAIELENRKLYFNGGQHCSKARKSLAATQQHDTTNLWNKCFGFHGFRFENLLHTICSDMHELVCLLSDLQDMTKNGIWEGSRDYLVHAGYYSTTNPIGNEGVWPNLENKRSLVRWEIVGWNDTLRRRGRGGALSNYARFRHKKNSH